MLTLSQGHIVIYGGCEYFVRNRTLYRAPVANALSEQGYRMGADALAAEADAMAWIERFLYWEQELAA